MNNEIEIVHIGELDDIDVGSVENFEHDEKDYAIFHLKSGYFATQGHCNCEEKTFLSEAAVNRKNWNVLVVGMHMASFQEIQ